MSDTIVVAFSFLIDVSIGPLLKCPDQSFAIIKEELQAGSLASLSAMPDGQVSERLWGSVACMPLLLMQFDNLLVHCERYRYVIASRTRQCGEMSNEEKPSIEQLEITIRDQSGEFHPPPPLLNQHYHTGARSGVDRECSYYI